MEKPESGVAVFFDSDGSLYWKTADGVVRRGAWVTDRDAVLGSSAVDVGVGSASTICIRDGVRVEDVDAMGRVASAINSETSLSGNGYARARGCDMATTFDYTREQLRRAATTPLRLAPIERTHAHERASAPPTQHEPTVESAPKVEPHTKPIVRCGQRWRLDGVEVELYDVVTVPERGSFMVICGLYKARNWEGVRVNVSADALKERGVFLSGPTEPETHAEAVRRVLELEAASPPDGLSRDEWRARLINRLRDDIKLTGTVRMMVCAAREEHAEKWRKFGGGR